jgi:Zn-dependent protease with chaperone function
MRRVDVAIDPEVPDALIWLWMSAPGTWPLLAFILVPGVFAWWSGRRLLSRRDDPALAERLLARAQHTQRITLLSSVALPFATGPYFWLAMLALLTGLWIGDYPARRVLLDERWTLGTYLGWQLSFHVAWLGFWLTLLLAPMAIAAAGAWHWPVAATLALVLGVWATRYADVFVWLVRARGRLMRPEWQPIVDRSHAARPRLFEMPVPGGRFVNAFAFPSPSAPSVLFTDPALELLSTREQAAIFAHEVAHLEHRDRRRCHLAAAVAGALAGVGTLGVALVLEYLPAGPFIPLWSLVLIFAFLLKTARGKAHETASDLRALELCEDPEALVSGLTKLSIAGRMPRRWSAELEHGASHPSLARRLHAIRRVAAIPVMPFDDTLVVATERAGALIVLDRDGVSWVEARDPRQRDPEILRATARSRWSVPYDELVELRVRAFLGGGASLVARDKSGASRAARIAPGDIAALQRKLDAIEHRLAHDTVTPEPPEALGRFAALGLGIAATLVEGLLSLCLITALVALIRPSRAALAAVAAVIAISTLVWTACTALRTASPAHSPFATSAARARSARRGPSTTLCSARTACISEISSARCWSGRAPSRSTAATRSRSCRAGPGSAAGHVVTGSSPSSRAFSRRSRPRSTSRSNTGVRVPFASRSTAFCARTAPSSRASTASSSASPVGAASATLSRAFAPSPSAVIRSRVARSSSSAPPIARSSEVLSTTARPVTGSNSSRTRSSVRVRSMVAILPCYCSMATNLQQGAASTPSVRDQGPV